MSNQQDSSPASGGAGASSTVNVQQLKSQFANRFQANRPLVLKLHSILTWEQDIYPVFVAGAVSLVFLIIHLLNSSILATLSYLGIAVALLDLAMPTIIAKFCTSCASSSPGKGAKQSSEKDSQRFDKICLDMAKIYALMKNVCNMSCALKSSKPKLYYPALLGSLLVLAYVGNKFNNLFLTYLVTLFIVLSPGLDKKGFLSQPARLLHQWGLM